MDGIYIKNRVIFAFSPLEMSACTTKKLFHLPQYLNNIIFFLFHSLNSLGSQAKNQQSSKVILPDVPICPLCIQTTFTPPQTELYTTTFYKKQKLDSIEEGPS